MLKNKKLLIEEIGMKFDEASALFSDETLESMAMVNIVGGVDTNTYCGSAQCGQCGQCTPGCQNQCSGCGGSGTTGGNSGNSGNGGNSGNSGTIGNGNNNGSGNKVQAAGCLDIQGFLCRPK